MKSLMSMLFADYIGELLNMSMIILRVCDDVILQVKLYMCDVYSSCGENKDYLLGLCIV